MGMGDIMTWEIKKVIEGEQGQLLKEGWEPFSTGVAQDSYYYMNTSSKQREQQIRSTLYIYFRREVPK
jgi:hypothetical protein